MLKIFDYIFYRVCFFYRKKKDLSPETTGWILNSILQSFTLLDLFLLIRIIYEYPIPKNFNKIWVLPLIALFFVLNWFRYEKRITYNELYKKWNDEEKRQKRKKGTLIVLYCIISILIPILYGLIRHNIMEGKSFFGQIQNWVIFGF